MKKFPEGENYTDFISMSRPLIHEPDLPNLWKSGDISPAYCIRFNSCYKTMFNGEVYCVVRKRPEIKKLKEDKRFQKKI